jgi:DNA-binding SARP family transcriptional activator
MSLRSVVSRTILESDSAERAKSIASGDPRVVVLAAPPGYGKNALLRSFAARIGTLLICELPAGGDVSELARAALDALVSAHGERAARSAANRLAQRRELVGATSRETLRREWAIDSGPEVFALYDPSGTLATPAGADLFAGLTAGFPAARRLAVSTRAPLPPALQQMVSRERTVSVLASDLALPHDAVVGLARSAGLPAATGAIVYDVARGWPLASKLLIRLFARIPAEELLDAVSAVPHHALLAFAAHRTIASLDERVREALIVTMLLRRTAHRDLVRVLGEQCDDAVFARLVDLPFVECENDRAVVHPEIARLVRERLEPVVRGLYERTLDALAGDGAYVDAAGIALDAGDVERAAAIIDAAPPYTAAPVPLGTYERVIDRIGPDLVTRYPNVWVATRPYRTFSVDRATYIREAETVYHCLPPASSSDQRASVLMHLASAYFNVGRAAEADQLIDEALRGFASGNIPARAAILNLAASLRGIEGRFSLARSLAAQASAISRNAFGETQTLHYIESHEAVYRGRQDRFVVIMDELLRRHEREALPLYLAYAGTNGAIFSWVSGDDAAFQRYLTILEDAMTPGLSPAFGPIVDAARGRPARLDNQYMWPEMAAVMHLYRMGTATNDRDALDAARAAVHAADQRGDPFVRTLAHVALYVLDESVREDEARILTATAALIESAELHDAVSAVVEGRPAGMLASFVARRVRRRRERAEPRVTVELVTGRVSRDGVAIRLTDKEFELMAFLASNHGLMSRQRIGEALWEHLDPEEWRNNFKVTLHRIRTKLAMHDIVLTDEARYRLAPSVEVDLRRAERLVREDAAVLLDAGTRDELRAIVLGFRGGTAARYDRFAWAHSLLAHLNDVICRAGIALANDALARHADDEALRHASDVAAIDPFNEQACEMVVRIRIGRGDIDGARREFRRYANALASELGAAPSKSLAELVRNPV